MAEVVASRVGLARVLGLLGRLLGLSGLLRLQVLLVALLLLFQPVLTRL